jgi:putative DNA primase/helicase
VRKASDDYFAEQDTLEQWIDECISAEAQAFAASRELFLSWKSWAEPRNLFVGSEKALVADLKNKGYEHDKFNFARGFKGIRVRTPQDKRG